MRDKNFHPNRNLAPQMKKHIHRTQHVQIQVQDDRTGMDAVTLKRALLDNLYYIQAKNTDRGSLTGNNF